MRVLSLGVTFGVTWPDPQAHLRVFRTRASSRSLSRRSRCLAASISASTEQRERVEVVPRDRLSPAVSVHQRSKDRLHRVQAVEVGVHRSYLSTPALSMVQMASNALFTAQVSFIQVEFAAKCVAMS